jgi:hypothetical protein
MYINQGDYQGLVKELQTVRGKDFTPTQAESLIASFQTIEWGAACWIVKNITRLTNLPNNLYGLVLDRIDQQKYTENKRLEQKTTWKSEEKCLSPEEFALTMNIIGKICQMDNSCERLKKFSEYSQTAIDQNNLLDFLKLTLEKIDEYITVNVQEKKDSAIAALAERIGA